MEGKAFGGFANIFSLILEQVVRGTWLFSPTTYRYSDRLFSNQGRSSWEARKYHHHHQTDHPHHHPPRRGTRGKILWEAALGGGGSGSQRLGSGSSPEYVFDYFVFSSFFLYSFWIVSLSFSFGKFKNQDEHRWVCWALGVHIYISSKKHDIVPATNCPRLEGSDDKIKRVKSCPGSGQASEDYAYD